MKVTTTPIEGLLVLEPRVFEDERGWFMESFNQKVFDEAVGRHVEFVQDNHSFSKKGVLRGLHYQLPPHAQGKLVRVVQGAVWDVAVDIRKSSPTFGKWFGLELSAENKKQLWIPEGFAHGFLTLSETAEFLYKVSSPYSKSCERTMACDSPELRISWPTSEVELILSSRDAAGVPFSASEVFQ
jgi:dTDP-4-dehydrorhamnose 3,5-epimerase